MNSDFVESSYEQLKNVKPGFYWFRNDYEHIWIIVEVYFTGHDIPRARVCPTWSEHDMSFGEFRGELGSQIIPPPD